MQRVVGGHNTGSRIGYCPTSRFARAWESNSASVGNNSQCFSKNGGASSSENANRSRDPAGQAQAAATRPRAEAEAAVVEADKKASFRACPGVVGHVLISVLLNGGLRK